MLENQFIQFYDSLEEAMNTYPVDVVVGHRGTQIIFDWQADEIFALDMDGETEIDSDAIRCDDDLNGLVLFSQNHALQPLINERDGKIFILKTEYEGADARYSNRLRINKSTEGFAHVEYRCKEDCFGFPFSQIQINPAMYLPISISKPQFKQEDKTYTKTNGDVVVLYAKYFKEWQGETDYMPEEMHEKLIAALSCDEIYIDGVRLAKSDSYEVNWDSSMKIECEDNKYKLAKASFKVSATTNSRNSNY